MPSEVAIDEKHSKSDIVDEIMNTKDLKTNKLHVVKKTDITRDGIGDLQFENITSKSDPIGSGWGLKGCEWSEMSFGRRSLYQLERLCYICGAASQFYWPGIGGGGAGCRGLVRAIQVLVLAGCVYPGFSRASERSKFRIVNITFVFCFLFCNRMPPL